MTLKADNTAPRPSPLIGNNELMLNSATMIAAVQMYLDAAFAPGSAPKVTAIIPKHDGPASIYTVRTEGTAP